VPGVATISHRHCRNPNRYTVIIDIPGDDCPRANDRAFSDSYAIQNTTTCSDPDVVCDDYSLFGERLQAHWYVGSLKPMIEWNNDGVGTDHRIASDHQTSMSIENAIWSDVRPESDCDSSAIRRDDDAVGDSHFIVNDDLPSELPAICV
jgi:hypothetical protein